MFCGSDTALTIRSNVHRSERHRAPLTTVSTHGARVRRNKTNIQHTANVICMNDVEWRKEVPVRNSKSDRINCACVVPLSLGWRFFFLSLLRSLQHIQYTIILVGTNAMLSVSPFWFGARVCECVRACVRDVIIYSLSVLFLLFFSRCKRTSSERVSKQPHERNTIHWKSCMRLMNTFLRLFGLHTFFFLSAVLESFFFRHRIKLMTTVTRSDFPMAFGFFLPDLILFWWINDPNLIAINIEMQNKLFYSHMKLSTHSQKAERERERSSTDNV